MRQTASLWAVLFLIAGCMFFSARPAAAQAAETEDTGDPTTKLSNDDLVELSLGMAARKPPPACVEKIEDLAKQAVTAKSALPLEKVLSFNTDQLCTTYLILSSKQFAAAVKEFRSDALLRGKDDVEKLAEKKLKTLAQQNGSSSGTGGSTNLTSKGLSSKVLSIASEYGALTQTVSGQTTTAAGSFAGIPLALLGQGYLVDCKTQVFAVTPCVHHRTLEQLARFSYSVSFQNNPNSTNASGTAVGGTTAGTVQQVNVTANSRSINAFSVKWAYGHKVDKATLDEDFKQIAASPQAKAVSDAVTKVQKIQLDLTAPKAKAEDKARFSGFLKTSSEHLLGVAQKDGPGESVVEAWGGLADDFATALGASEVVEGAPKDAAKDAARQAVLLAAAELGKVYNAYLGAEEQIADKNAVPPVFSFEYDDNRPASEPSNSVFRAILQHKTKVVSLTANGAASIYNSDQSLVPGAGRVRDVQFAAQGDRTFNVKSPVSSSVAATLSGAFYFQYQNSPAILNVTPGMPVDGVTFTGLPSTATKVFATKGNIEIGQIKLTIGGGSSVTVPLSVTYSNRTELVTNPTWKAQIGVSYDFDSLFSGLK